MQQRACRLLMKQSLVLAYLISVLFSFSCSFGDSPLRIIHNDDLVIIDTLVNGTETQINRIDNVLLQGNGLLSERTKKEIENYAFSLADSLNKKLVYPSYTIYFFKTSDILDIKKIHTYSKRTRIDLFAESEPLFEYW
jgi:hypothetical protein